MVEAPEPPDRADPPLPPSTSCSTINPSDAPIPINSSSDPLINPSSSHPLKSPIQLSLLEQPLSSLASTCTPHSPVPPLQETASTLLNSLLELLNPPGIRDSLISPSANDPFFAAVLQNPSP